MKSDFLVIHKSICPKNYMKVIEARKLIESEKMSISEACLQQGISRGTFYNYKDYIFLPSSELGKKAILSFVLDNQKGILSNVLNVIASQNGNILAINQEMPINDTAYVTITIDIIDMTQEIGESIRSLKKEKGVKNVQLIAIE